MTNFFYYTIEVAISMFLFFAVWKTFLQKETFHGLHRTFLLASFILSFIIPAFHIELQSTNQIGLLNQITETIQFEEVIITSGNNSFFSIQLFINLYIAVSLILLFRFLYRLILIVRFANKCTVQFYKGQKIYLSEKQIAPFSFFNYIFFNKDDISKASFERILQHELIHTKEKHSIDIILPEIAIVIMWFNPMIYIYKNHFKMLHEYLSDEKVILQGFEADEYKMLLIKQQIGHQFEFANHFNKSLTIKRINMINKLKSNRKAKLKTLLVIPVIGLTLVLFSFSGNKQIVSSNENIAPQDSIFLKVDEMPVFPGGDIALRRFVGTNVNYPASARKNKIQGTVYVKFIVDKKGKVGKAEIQRGVSKELDNEAKRVIMSLPNFEKPGYQNGKAVNVWYSMPITFKLK